MYGSSTWLPNEGNPTARVAPGVGDSRGSKEATWAFPPGSPGASGGPAVPDEFREWLKAHDERLTVTWHPVLERHVIWCRNRQGGWSVSMLCENPFPHRWADLEPGARCPLDGRIKAQLLDSDPRRYGGGAGLYTAMADKHNAMREADLKRRLDKMMDQRERAIMHSSIRIGYGDSKGSKFSEMYR